MKYRVKKYLQWRKWVVPELLHDRPIHRWLVFPHSFTDDIVKALATEWKLGAGDLLVDPFVGAGTTVLAAKQAGVPACGFDLSPLAVLAGNVKVANYRQSRLREHWKKLSKALRARSPNGECQEYSELVQKALPGRKLATMHAMKQSIAELEASEGERDFFRLAMIALLPRFSNAVATGGWLSWEPNHATAAMMPKAMRSTVRLMFDDLEASTLPRLAGWGLQLADARRLPLKRESCSAVITSPPYPNRHDYTRVFGVELMFGMLDWEQTRQLRYQMFHSHPEAKPVRPRATGYEEPDFVTRAIDRVGQNDERERIVEMLRGYFLDLYLCLREVRRVLRHGGHAALVLGNAQYDGVAIQVDKATAAIGEQAGLTCKEIRVVRERGNSAQQMKRLGRHPSRESVIIFVKS